MTKLAERAPYDLRYRSNIMSMAFRVGFGCVVAGLMLAGCASSSDVKQSQANAVVHAASEADRAATTSKEPLRGDKATLYVNGLGCPQCAYNADIQLRRVKGVSSTSTDLASGTIGLEFVGKDRPSAYQIREAIADAGFTLMKVTTP